MRNPRGSVRHSADMIIVLGLFAFLVIIGLLMISMGTGVFRNVLDSMNRNDEYRTASAYITQKVRQNQDAGAVKAGNLEGSPAILLYQNSGGQEYITYLYCDGTHLKELLSRADNTSLAASAGSDILELKSMNVETETNSLLVTLTGANGKEQKLRVSTEP